VAHSEVGIPDLSLPGLTPAVEVLLATYNGERFLGEQIDSILAQDYPRLRILVRDDGSQDATWSILCQYAGKYPSQIRLMDDRTPTGSPQGNFLRLMLAATADYVCFADQDDVWLPDKVSRSMAAMKHLEQQHGTDAPLLVFSDLRVVDEDLRPIAPSMWRRLAVEPNSAQRLERLLGRSVVTGCTMAINPALLRRARRMPPEAAMHDRWIALLAACMGASGIVSGQTVLYRQHADNAIGAAASDGSMPGLARRAARGGNRRAERLRCESMAEALLRLHADEMPPRSAATLRAFLRSGRSDSALERVLLTLRHGFRRGHPLKTLVTLFDLARARSTDADA
jgi:hypothetical protein